MTCSALASRRRALAKPFANLWNDAGAATAYVREVKHWRFPRRSIVIARRAEFSDGDNHFAR